MFWLITELVKDPASHVFAAHNGWAYPLSWEAIIAAAQFDAFVSANVDSKYRSQVKPFPRPWDKQPNRWRATVPQSKVRAALAARGH